jgi:hypothetical protein
MYVLVSSETLVHYTTIKRENIKCIILGFLLDSEDGCGTPNRNVVDFYLNAKCDIPETAISLLIRTLAFT